MNIPTKIISQVEPEKSVIVAADEAVSLGIYTENSSAASLSRFLRYALQKAVCELLPESRVTACLKLIIPGREGVDVLYSDERQRARLGNLCMCGLRWICPVCASRISEGRSALLSAAMKAVQVNPLLITFTMSHGASQRLAPNLDALLDAYKGLTHGRMWQSFKERYGWLTSIRALEVTHGDNGWHPHIHVLAFMKQPLHYDEQFMMDVTLSELWIARLGTQNASADAAHGVDIRTAKKDAIEYVAKFGREPSGKWGIERELTKAVTKNARWKGRTPFALLNDYYFQADRHAGNLFREYEAALKGHVQLVISKDARELLHLKEVTDNELADGSVTEFDERLMRTLDKAQWTRVLFGDLKIELLKVASTGSSDQLAAWLMRVGVL